MSDQEPQFRRFIGRVVFPRGPQDLLSTTTCPACFSPLRSTTCTACGLDLSNPTATELHEASLEAAEALDRRLSLIGKIRYDTARAQQPQVQHPPAVAAPAAAPAPAVAAPRQEPLPHPAPSAVLSTPATPQLAPRAPRRSSVQVTMLIVGVSLLSIAAIFFLVYAFINFGIVWRSVIIAAITVAALVVASVLKSRNLTATAEGIAAFGVVLVYLDAYALRANDLFGAAQADGAEYWGLTLVITAIGFTLWHRVSGLRIPNIAGFASFAPGVGVLVSGLTNELEAETQAFLSFSAIALAGLVHAFAPRRALPATDGTAARPPRAALPERALVLGTTILSLLVAFLVAFGAFPSSDWAPAAAATGLAVIAAFHAAVLLFRGTAAGTPPFNRVFSYLLSGLASATLASALWLAVLRLEASEPLSLLVPALWAAVVALALEGAAVAERRRTAASAPERPSAVRFSLIVGGWSAAGVTALAMVAPVVIAIASVGTAAARTAVPTWVYEPGDLVTRFSADSGWAVLAIAALTALAALVWTIIGRLRARAVALTVGTALALVAAAPELGVLWAVMASWLLIAVVGVSSLLLIARRVPSGRRYRAVLLVTMIVAGVLGYLLGWATPSTWWVGTLAVVAILLVSRGLVDSAGARAALLGTGTAITILSAGFFADQFALAASAAGGAASGNATLADHVLLTAMAAVAFLIAASFTFRLVEVTDKRVVFWTAGALGASALTLSTIVSPLVPVESQDALLFPPDLTGLIVAVATLIAIGLWVLLPGNQPLRVERITASIAAGPVLYLVFVAFARVLEIPQLVAGVAPITAALFAAVGALAITTLWPSSTPRWARELSVVLVGVPTVVAAVTTADSYTWLILVIAAIAALLLAVDGNGLFSSHSARRHLGWLAIILGTAGLWWRLSDERVTELLYYLLPLFLVLFLVARFIQRAARRSTPAYDSRVAPFVTLAGVLVLILPLGSNEVTESPTTLGIYFIAAIVLLIGGSVTVGKPVTQWNADALATAGAITVLAIAGTRSAFLPFAGVDRDLWLVATFVPLTLAAFLQAYRKRLDREAIRARASQWLVIAALTLALSVETVSYGSEPEGGVRAAVLVMGFAAVHVLAHFVNRPPITQAVAWVAIGFGALTGYAGWIMGALDPVEIATVPIAIALLVTSTHHLITVPTARSWARVGPATALLLIPSLVSTADDNALWRLVSLGVVGIAVIVAAVAAKLQAPFAIGVVVVLWHGIATFLPQLRAAYEFFPWWLWLGVGGVLLIVLAARYEQRIRDLKNVVTKFAALR